MCTDRSGSLARAASTVITEGFFRHLNRRPGLMPFNFALGRCVKSASLLQVPSSRQTARGRPWCIANFQHVLNPSSSHYFERSVLFPHDKAREFRPRRSVVFDVNENTPSKTERPKINVTCVPRLSINSRTLISSSFGGIRGNAIRLKFRS